MRKNDVREQLFRKERNDGKMQKAQA